MPDKLKFNPEEHLIDIKGKPYLPVAWRLVWFRTEHPDWSIETEIKDDATTQRATARCTIKDETGRIIAVAHKTAKPRGIITDYVELAETGSIGRCLSYIGYGTQFSPELEEDEVVDSPIEIKKPVMPIFEPHKPIQTPTPATSDVPMSTVPQLAKIRALYGEKKLDSEAMKLVLKQKYGVSSHKELTRVQASEYIQYLIDNTILPIEDLDGELPVFN